MNINSISSSLRYNPYAAPIKYSGTSFAELLNATKNASGSQNAVGMSALVVFPYQEKQILRVDAEDDLGRKQSIRVEYTADSTAEDPIVWFYGTSYYGEYSCVRRLRDIDLNNATYPEMYALLAHEKALEMERTNGESRFQEAVNGITYPSTDELTLENLVKDTDAGDFMQQCNFLAEYAERNSLDKVSLSIQITADETVEMEYRANTSQKDAEEAAEFERLMRIVDNFIEEQRENARVAAEKAEKEKIDRLFEAKQDEHNRALKRSDHEKLLEGLL